MYEEAVTQTHEEDAVRWGKPRREVREALRKRDAHREAARKAARTQTLTPEAKAAIDKRLLH